MSDSIIHFSLGGVCHVVVVSYLSFRRFYRESAIKPNSRYPTINLLYEKHEQIWKSKNSVFFILCKFVFVAFFCDFVSERSFDMEKQKNEKKLQNGNSFRIK